MTKKQVLKIFKAMAQKNRLSAVLLLKNKKKGLCHSDIATRLKIEPTLLSHHLTILLGAGIVTKKREGKKIRYFAQELDLTF